MMFKMKIITLLIFFLHTLSGCAVINSDLMTPPAEMLTTPIPTPSTFDIAINFTQSKVADERIVGMWTILNYPERIQSALPFITKNLYYEQNSEVRSAAARVLGEIGENAKSSVPEMIEVIQNEQSSDVKVDIAIALGKIGETRAVPILAEHLYHKDNNVSGFSAKSISMLTGESFPDSDTNFFRLDEQGTPLIVIAAREWWTTKGQFIDWDN